MVPFYTYFITCNSTATIKDVIGTCNAIRETAPSCTAGVNYTVSTLHVTDA